MLLEELVSTSLTAFFGIFFDIGLIQDYIIKSILLSHVVDIYQFNPIKLHNMNIRIGTNFFEPIFFSQDDTGFYPMPVFMISG